MPARANWHTPITDGFSTRASGVSDRLDLDLVLEAGEELQIEISAKFEPTLLRSELSDAGFDDAELNTDESGTFSLLLARRSA